MFTIEQMHTLFPNADDGVVDGFAATMALHGHFVSWSDPRHAVDIVAHVGHESGGLRYMEELGDASKYEGRANLGNTETGDGVRFKGRGPLQLTGRSNYTAFGRWLRDEGIRGDPVGDPESVSRFPLAGLSVIFFWVRNDLARWVETDNFVTLTERINGGQNGLDDRWRWRDRASLVLLGYEPTDVRGFQESAGLQVDGIAGNNTRAALRHLLDARAAFGDGSDIIDVQNDTDDEFSDPNPPSKILPRLRPQQSARHTRAVLAHFAERYGWTPEPVCIMRVEGYYGDSFGRAGNDRGVYDDATFVITPDGVVPFNGNVDPSRYRPGIAKLKVPQAIVHKPGPHGYHRPGGPYPALRQHSDVTVIRDGRGEDRDGGGRRHWINDHRGGSNGTSSAGCLTTPPSQWDEYLALVTGALEQYGQEAVTTYLVSYDGDEAPVAEPVAPPTPSASDRPTPAPAPVPHNDVTSVQEDEMPTRKPMTSASPPAGWRKIAKMIFAGIGGAAGGAAGGAGMIAVTIPDGVEAPWYAYLIASALSAAFAAFMAYIGPRNVYEDESANAPSRPPPPPADD